LSYVLSYVLVIFCGWFLFFVLFLLLFFVFFVFIFYFLLGSFTETPKYGFYRVGSFGETPKQQIKIITTNTKNNNKNKTCTEPSLKSTSWGVAVDCVARRVCGLRSTFGPAPREYTCFLCLSKGRRGYPWEQIVCIALHARFCQRCMCTCCRAQTPGVAGQPTKMQNIQIKQQQI
jgi:hypothetical protein